MARSKVTQGRVDYLVSLGFEISDSLSTDKVRKMYKDVKALENAFASIGKELPKMLGTQTFEEYFQKVTAKMNDMGDAQYATFTSMKNNIVQVQKAMGDLNYVIEKFNDKGLQDSQLFKSKAASDPRNTDFFSLDEQETLDKQTEAYTLKVGALGDNVEKTLIKLGIQDTLQKTNSELANFLKANLDDIENYITRTQTMYDSEGNAIKSFVELAVKEYGKLKIAMNYKDVSADNGNIKARIGTKGVQTSTVNIEKAYKNLKSSMQEVSNIQQKINQAEQSGNTATVSALNKEKEAIDKVVESRKEQYKALVGAEKYQTDLSNIREEIQLTEQLNSAQQQDAQTKKQQQQQVNNIKNDLNSYLTILSETKKIEASGDNTYGARLEYNREMMEQLATSINQYIPNVVQLDSDTGKLSINFEELSKVFANNKTALEQLTQIYKNYNNETKKQDTTTSHQENSKKIDETIKKMQELFNAQKALTTLKAKAAPVEDIEEAESAVRKLTQELKDLSSQYLSNGKAVSQTEEYTEAYKKVLIELENAQRRATTGAKDQVSVLGKLFGSFGQVVSNVIKYNLAQYGLEEAFQKTVETIKTLDEQMTNIRLVQNNSEASAKEMLQTYSDMAYELGTTTEAVAEGSIEWLLIRSLKISLIAGSLLEVNILT